MFPGGNTNANLGYNKHNQYMQQPSHFLAAPVRGPGPVPSPAIGNPLGAAAAATVMPLNMQGSIDWAQLAQQWIHMRDSSAAPPMANFSMNMPIAPPPPIISNAPEYHQHQHHQHHQPAMRLQQVKTASQYEEHGEAEMDMDIDEEENENNVRALHHIESLPPPPIVTQSQWMAGRANNVPIHPVPSSDAIVSGTQKWNDWSTRNNPTSHIPSLLKLNICNPNEPPQMPLQTHQPPHNITGGGAAGTSSDIDANKRKMLPAWIREGLEKMEREKQRQLERQQRTSPEPELPAINVKQVSSKTLTTPVNQLNMSNVASDSEDSIAADEEATHASNKARLIGNDVLSKPTNSSDEHDHDQDDDDDDEDDKQQQQDSVSRDNAATVAGASNAETALSGKNYEERLADLMLVVRRTLTEILLETTNEEIAAIATETLKAHRAKASSAQVIRKSALSSITGNLGLAVYGDSSSDSENDDAADGANEGAQLERIDASSKDDDDDTAELSMEELKARIRKSKRAFEKVIDDIEERVSQQEQLDEEKLLHHRQLELEQAEAARESAQSDQRHTDMPADETATATTAASTSDKLHQFSVKRPSRKERTTRFSDNKDGKPAPNYVSQVVAAATAPSSSILPQKPKPVPNPATNLLQMPESMASVLNAANKALDKANKTSKKSKSRRRRQSTSSSSSSSDSSTRSSSSDTNTSSNTSKSSRESNGSSTRSSAAAKKHGKSSRQQSRGSSGHRQRRDSSRKGRRKESRHNYDRHRSSHESRERDRDRDRHTVHYISQQKQQKQQQHRPRGGRHQHDSSNSAEEEGSSSYRRGSRHSSSRSHQSSSYSKHRERTRSRSNSRSTHNSHSSVSTSHPHRKRK